MRKTKLDLMAEMLNFSLMTSLRLMTISPCQKLGVAWWVLGYILVIKGETERNYILPYVKFSEVSKSSIYYRALGAT